MVDEISPPACLKHVHDGSWQVEAQKVSELPLEEKLWAAEFEFNLPVSDEMKLGRHRDVCAAVAGVYQNKAA
jgi:hypothetical protein